MAEESRPVSYYKSLSTEDLEAEITREEEMIVGLRDQLTEAIEKRDEVRETIKKERLFTVEERTRAREAEIRVLETRIAERETTIRYLEGRVRALEARLKAPLVSPTERYITTRVIQDLRRSIGAYMGWQTRDKRVLRALRGWLTREGRAVDRFSELRRELLEWITEVYKLKEQISLVEEELEKKREAVVRYKIVEYTMYFEVRVRRPKKTPPIKFEVRGEFTIPGQLDNADPKVISIVEAKLTEGFREWGSPQMRRVVTSDLAYSLAVSRGEVPEGEPGSKFTRRAEGGYWKISGPYGGINLEYYTSSKPTFGAEEVATTDKFVERVDVVIVKYIGEDQVGGPWVVTVTVKEEEFM